LPLTISTDNIRQGLAATSLAGRFELRRDLNTGKTVVFDVAHNPAAAQLLATGLRQFKQENPSCKSISVVLAVMADKDIDGIAIALETCLDIWYIAQVNEARSMPVEVAARRVGQSVAAARVITFESVFQAYKTACEQSADEDLVVVTGSFFTVAALRELSEAL
jgi:dihydrofolate synthase/folylpolyglutamate synthase